VPQLDVPDGTGRVRMVAFWDGPRRPALGARLKAGNQMSTGELRGAPSATNEGAVDIPLPETQLDGDSAPGSLCVATAGPLAFGGMVGLQADQRSPTVGGKSLGSRVAVWFLPPEGDKRAALSLLGDVVRRAALFRPGPIGPWFYVVLLLVVWPVLAYCAIRLLATRGGDRPGIRTALAVDRVVEQPLHRVGERHGVWLGQRRGAIGAELGLRTAPCDINARHAAGHHLLGDGEREAEPHGPSAIGKR